MATFRIYLVGQPHPIRAEFPLADIHELLGAATHSRFLIGSLADPDEQGVLAPIMVATGRIQCLVEEGI